MNVEQNVNYKIWTSCMQLVLVKTLVHTYKKNTENKKIDLVLSLILDAFEIFTESQSEKRSRV